MKRNHTVRPTADLRDTKLSDYVPAVLGYDREDETRLEYWQEPSSQTEYVNFLGVRWVRTLYDMQVMPFDVLANSHRIMERIKDDPDSFTAQDLLDIGFKRYVPIRRTNLNERPFTEQQLTIHTTDRPFVGHRRRSAPASRR